MGIGDGDGRNVSGDEEDEDKVEEDKKPGEWVSNMQGVKYKETITIQDLSSSAHQLHCELG